MATTFCLLTVNVGAAEPIADDLAYQSTSTAVDPLVLEEARQLLTRNQAERAYQLLLPYEADWAGDRDYDYLLGASAVDSKRPSEAILALQRVIAVYPGYSAARMELARAYYEVGDKDSARREFQELQRENPPPYARKVIANYLAAINRSIAQSEPRFRYYVQFDLGYDGNANGATGSDQFLGFTLNDHNVSKASGYLGFTNGGTWSRPVTPQLTNYTSFDLEHRRNFAATFVNYDRGDIGDSLVWRQGPLSLNGGVTVFGTLLGSRLPFDGDLNQYGEALDLGAHRLFGSDWRVGADAHLAALRYDHSIDVYDVNQALYDVSIEHVDTTLRELTQGIVLITGKDHARLDNSPYGRDQNGARYTLSFLIDPITRFYFYTGFLKSDYDGSFFGFNRKDEQSTGGIYLVWKAFSNPNWAVIPRIAYTDNSSTVSLYRYHRFEAALSLRWMAD